MLAISILPQWIHSGVMLKGEPPKMLYRHYMYMLCNGKRCRDGVKVLWCHSHLVWSFFKGSIPPFACFRAENFFVTLL